jgi:hypothetical protein
MPAPDPHGVSIGWGWPDSITVDMKLWGCGNKRTRKRRAIAILANLRHGGWCCPACNRPVPLYRRADATYCSTACRKRRARARRKVGETGEPKPDR